MKTRNLTKQVAMASLAAIGIAFAALSAHADAFANAPERTVHYADLNLNTAAGISVLYNRIRAAAEQVCDGVNSRRLEEAREAKVCVARALQASVRSVNNARLTEAYETHLGVAPDSIKVASID